MNFFGQIQLAFLFFLFSFLTRDITQSESKYYFLFNSVSYYCFLVSRDGRVFVCFYRRVPICLLVLLSVVVVVVVAKMYVLFMNVA